MTLNGPKQLNGPNGVVIHGDTNDFWFFFMDFYVGRPCENFRRIQWDTILECKKRGHWRPFEIQLCNALPTEGNSEAPSGKAGGSYSRNLVIRVADQVENTCSTYFINVNRVKCQRGSENV